MAEIPSFAAILDDIWSRLAAACDQASLAWGVPVLSTVAGSGPAARSVVLRRIDREKCQLFAYTDARSPKCTQLAENSQAIWTFYDPADRVQLIARTQVSLLRDEPLVDECWNGSRPESLHCYLGEHAPGTAIEHPRQFSGPEPTLTELAGGRPNFVVLQAQILQLDWLALRRSGNLRARFSGEPADWHAEWLMP